MKLRPEVPGALVVALLVVGACGGSPATTATSSPAQQATSAATASPPLVKKVVRFIQGGDFLNRAPIYVAVGKHFFEEEGLDFQITKTPAGPNVMATLLSGNADMSTGQMGEAFSVLSAGQQIKAVSGDTHDATISCAIRPDVLSQLKLPANADWKAKSAALKGRNIGVASIGGSVHQTARFIVKGGGLDPDKDVNITAIGGDPLAWIAAFQNKQIDWGCAGAPNPQAAIVAKAAVSFIDPLQGEVDPLKGMGDVMALTTPGFIQKDPEAVQRVVNAWAKALRFIRTNPAESAKFVKDLGLPNVDQAAFDLAWQQFQPIFNDRPTITQEMFDKAAAFYTFSTGKAVSVKLGDLYDASFAGKVK